MFGFANLESRVKQVVEQHVAAVASLEPLAGGDVANAYRVTLADGSCVFAKTHPDPPPFFFTTEATGLQWLADTEVVNVPTVLAVDDTAAVLVLEWIDEGRSGVSSSDADFGRSLAAMHATPFPMFGRPDKRTTGSRRLPNEPCHRWSDFYREQRLIPLAELASRSGALDPATVAKVRLLAERLDDVGGSEEPPALIHGDLWAGNRLVDRGGRNWLIDPAAHGGHREFDLAMMRLFGGFGPGAFAAYNEVLPLADGAEERVLLHQVAPLLVHAIKFGRPYVEATESAVSRYV